MDIEIENQIELLERKRDIALRIRNTLYAKKIQRVIDKLAKESRNKSMDDKKDKK